jgi:hypothetical protein
MHVSLSDSHLAAEVASVLEARRGAALYFTFVVEMKAIRSWSAALKVAVKRRF